MADEKKLLVPHQSPQLPARAAPSVPTLRSSAGGFALTPTSRAKKDAAFSRAYADQLRALADSYKAATEYSDARFDFAVALSKWQSLNEVCEHAYRKGFLNRTSELKVLALELETNEINARIARDAAMLALSAYQPQPPAPPPAPPPAAPAGLSPSEIEAVLQQFPDVKPEMIQPIVMMLRGVLAEKKP